MKAIDKYSNRAVSISGVHVLYIDPSYFGGDIADSTNITITASILPGGGSGMGVAVMSHKKAWHLLVSYRLFSYR